MSLGALMANATLVCSSSILDTSRAQLVQKTDSDKLSCDSSTGGWREKDVMTCRLSPDGFTEVMFRMFYDASCSCQGKY